MSKKGIELIVDFHKDGDRQGPGSDSATKLALDLCGLDLNIPLRIADIGCGTGAQTIALAKNTNSNIMAVDVFPEFLDKLEERAKSYGQSHKIQTFKNSMDNLPFLPKELDLIWAEGAIYIMGFENGVKYWKNFLKRNGVLAVSELSWKSEKRPKEIQDYWENAYPEIDTISNKTKILEENGFSPMAHFVLPDECWTYNYFDSIAERIQDFREKHNNSKEVMDFVSSEIKEIQIYEKYKEYFSYVFYISKNVFTL